MKAKMPCTLAMALLENQAVMAAGTFIRAWPLFPMTVKRANEWQVEIGSGLETLVNLKATIREQAAQAVRMANDIMLAARHAMEDANAAAQLMMTNPIRSFNELLQTLGKEFSGDVLYKKVIEKAKEMVGKVVTPRTVTEAGGCFAAGTLVHTKEGLKPIEQIQVGDWVLSKPEDGEGEQAYKRVAKTFSFEDKEVMRIRYGQLRDGEYFGDNLIVTPNHPFWVVGVDKSLYPDDSLLDDFKLGWTRADKLFPGVLIELTTGEHVKVMSSDLNRLWKTKQPDVAWEAHADDEQGRQISIKDGQGISIRGFEFHPDFRDDDTFVDRLTDPVWEEKWLYRCKVYNFEVEDFHTYYVGNLGAWVHNTNCYATTVEYLKKNGVLPSIARGHPLADLRQ